MFRSPDCSSTTSASVLTERPAALLPRQWASYGKASMRIVPFEV